MIDPATVNMILNVVTVVGGGGACAYWIKGMPERARVRNDTTALTAKIEEDLRSEAALRFKEFRAEVHGLRNELAVMAADLLTSHASGRKCADKLSMMGFVLQLVMNELRRLDKNSPILDQAEILLAGITGDEPFEADKSKALKQAEGTVTSAQNTVDEVKHSEAVTAGDITHDK